ncbi:cytochrome P450 monooxygenase pc-3 [Rhizoctonia solani AG-1 IA]|uniref:Cytochrome P450 monooxygenase pc-3 n=1 Tax=Thanatephorus cucumeris (strain AG1-IA) TaxID=983506 RepID=L8WL21_THACA|nr:cytochrome P450 monooxygenase pc-3 [Rhizoctonia solani AG-1 IA]
MPRSPITWGAGLSIVLGSLPSLVLPPALAVSVPLLLEQALPRDSASEFPRLFLDLPTAVRSIIALGVLAIIRTSIGRYQRQLDRKKFGPDVVEIPKIKLKWPLNLDFIPFDTNVMQNGKLEIRNGSKGTYVYRILWHYLGGHDSTAWEYFQLRTIRTRSIRTLIAMKKVSKVTYFPAWYTNLEHPGSDIQGIMFSLLGNGIFNSDGETWKFHRSMSRPYFTRDRISHFDNFARHADIAISKLLSRVSEPSRPAVDFQDLVARFTLDSGTEFLFGRDTRSLDAPLPYPHGKPADDSASFAAAFSRAQGQVMQRFGLAMFWPWMELFWDRTAEDMKIINAYVTPILRKKLERGSDIESKPTNEGDQDADTLLDHLVKFTQGEYMDRVSLRGSNKRPDESVIKDEIINILVAARDTTATTLTFAVYILAENPAIMSRLRDEITGRLGTSNHPTPDDLKEMKYLRAVINETLRLFPAVPVNVRAAAKSTVLHINGKRYYIPAGTSPTRTTLTPTDGSTIASDLSIPIPSEASFFLCRLLQRVETIELVPEAHPVGTLPRPGWKNGTGRRVYEKGGLWVRMKEGCALTAITQPETHYYPHPEPPEKWENELFRRLEVFEFGRFLKGKEPSYTQSDQGKSSSSQQAPQSSRILNKAAYAVAPFIYGAMLSSRDDLSRDDVYSPSARFCFLYFPIEMAVSSAVGFQTRLENPGRGNASEARDRREFTVQPTGKVYPQKRVLVELVSLGIRIDHSNAGLMKWGRGIHAPALEVWLLYMDFMSARDIHKGVFNSRVW